MCVYVCVRFPCKTLLLAVNRLWSGRVVSLHSLSSPVRRVCICVCVCVCVCVCQSLDPWGGEEGSPVFCIGGTRSDALRWYKSRKRKSLTWLSRSVAVL